MDPSVDDHIARLLRLKRYEQPPPDYFDNFLQEFRRRQRDELFSQPLWAICFERARGFALLLNVRSLAPAGLAVMAACAAVFSISLYQHPNITQLAIYGSPVPSMALSTEKQLVFPRPVFRPTLRPRSTVRMLPADLPSSNESIRVPLTLEWESAEDQSLLGK
jgi:hypothetical protein